MVTLTIKNIEPKQNTIMVFFFVFFVVDTFILYIHSSAGHNIIPFKSFIFWMQQANKKSSECPKTKGTQRLISTFEQ